MTTVNNKLKDETSDQFLVVGTENRQVLTVDALSNTTRAQQFLLCSYPEIGSLSTNDRPITVLSTGKYLVVPCMDETIYFYKGVISDKNFFWSYGEIIQHKFLNLIEK